jgi:hypothetical protein
LLLHLRGPWGIGLIEGAHLAIELEIIQAQHHAIAATAGCLEAEGGQCEVVADRLAVPGVGFAVDAEGEGAGRIVDDDVMADKMAVIAAIGLADAFQRQRQGKAWFALFIQR